MVSTALSPDPQGRREGHHFIAWMNDWCSQAACKGQTDLFFPDFEGLSREVAYRIVRQAVAVCRGCPVLRECREWVDEHPLGWGIVAGMTPRRRRRGARNRRRGVSEGSMRP